MKILLTVFALISSINVNAAVCSRTITFSDGSVLTAAQLNDEFNAAISCINGIDNSNIASNAAISASKISSSIAGDGIVRDVNTGSLSVNPDNSTIELSGGTVRVKDAGISTAKLATNAVTTVKITDSNVTAAKLATDSVTTAKIQNGAVTSEKLASQNIQSTTFGAFSTSSSSFVDVTGATLTITTSGRPVVIMGTTGETSSTPTNTIAACLVKIVRGATDIASFQLTQFVGSGVYTNYPTSSINFVDTPAAGTYTYKLQAKPGGGINCFFNSTSRLIAYEL